MRQEIAVKAIAKLHPKDTRKADLRHNGKNLNEENHENGSVPELHDTKRKPFCDSAGKQIGAEENNDKFAPHPLKRKQKAEVCKFTCGKHHIVERHAVDHHPRGNKGKEK